MHAGSPAHLMLLYLITIITFSAEYKQYKCEASHYGIPSDFLSLGSRCGSLPPGSCNNENKFLVLVREHMMLTNFTACPGVSQQHCHLQCGPSDLSCQHLMTLLCFHSHPGLPLQNHNEIHASWPAPLTINHSVYQVHNLH